MKYKNVLSVVLLALGLAACSSESATATPMQPTLPTLPTSFMQPTLPPMPLAGTASWTPEPTLSSDDLNPQQLGWQQELEARVGFSHPIFESIADNLPSNSIYFRRDAEPAVLQTTFEGIGYTAIVVDRSVGSAFRSFLLFRVVNDEPELIFSTGQESLTYNHVDNDGEDISGFADRNGNGYPDIAIDLACVCSQGWGNLQLLEIRSDGEVVDLTPHPDDTTPRRFADVNADGVLEILAFGNFGVPFEDLRGCCEPALTRYFSWDGTVYQDISATLTDLHYPLIITSQKMFQGRYTCVMPSLWMYNMLVSYYLMGRLAEGWAWLEPRLLLKDCNPNDAYVSYEIDQLYKWVNVRIAEEERRRLSN